MTHDPIRKKAQRDLRLDMFRGLALMTIFINHVPGNVLENYTSRNFGLSDAAEAFVFMSGIAVALASWTLVAAGRTGEAAAKLARRAGKLYIYHIAGMMVALGFIAITWYGFGVHEFGERVNFAPVAETPFKALVIGMPMLGYQIGYYNILPLYMLFLLMAPAMLWLGRRSIPLLLTLSGALWLVAFEAGLNMPNFPQEGGWFFHPFGWQFLFATGIAAGIAKKQGRALVAFRPWLYALALAWLVWCYWFLLQEWGWLPLDGTLPVFVTYLDKSHLALPRMVHLLALAYVLVNLPGMARLAASRLMAPVAAMGRNGLELFAFGSVLAIGLQAVFAVLPAPAWAVTFAVVAGIAVQMGVAALLDRRKDGRKAAAAGTMPAGALAARA
ncbi:MAG: OpgC domain-containing protein [Notoacmeibacter sp.]|nr:OpgC domain-containing protein [Notoacmeibacter sp.]